MHKRGSGILIHITSLPSAYGIGDLGPEAFKFVDFLANTKQSYWQILPLNPIDPICGSSPYHSISSLAGNLLFISPELLMKEKLLDKDDLDSLPSYPKGRVDYSLVFAERKRLLNLAYERFKKIKNNGQYERFCQDNANWLDDYALFVAIKEHFKEKVWSQWPSEIRDREPRALQSLRDECYDRIKMEKFIQYIFIRQWLELKGYCNKKGIKIIGDLPIYVQYNSVDVWVNPEIFKLDENKKPYVVAGVPPDYFSKTGQLWGNPLYQWDVLKQTGYEWWVKRIRHNLKLMDMLRIDHFRGFVAYWEVPVTEKTAINGKWVNAPAVDFFNQLIKQFPDFPVIAEDLGLITPDVRQIMKRFGFPGMKVLLFAFGEDNPKHPYLPENFEENCVVYTGTHDNNTIMGWFENEAKPEEKKRLLKYLKKRVSAKNLNWELIRLAMSSVADMSIFPVQDILGLGEEARLNIPATSQGNWQWRLLPGQLIPSLKRRLLRITETYRRAN